MQITSGSVQSLTRHAFEHDEKRISLRAETPSPAARLAELPLEAIKIEPPEFDPNDPSRLYGGRLGLLKALVEAMVGRPIDTLGVALQAAKDERTGNAVSSGAVASGAAVQSAANAARSVRTVAVDMVSVREYELTEVSFQGNFATADGQMIGIDLHYRLEREYKATTIEASVSTATMRDPLILNFDGLGVRLDARNTLFDLDGDGQAESIATLAAGSAYLALDIDGNGTIDRGSELFGPSTNNGFAELAQWDSDGNGFIDSADPIFEQLRLFRPGEELQTLADRDIAAIFLGAVASPARLTDAHNQSLGQLRATSFYLTNSGGAGLAQEIDLAV